MPKVQRIPRTPDETITAMLEGRRRAADVAARVLNDPRLVPELLDNLAARAAVARNKAGKTVVLVSEKRPDILYPHFERLAGLLEGKSSVLKWNAIQALANLASVDRDGKFERIFDKYFGLLREGSLITAANVAERAGRIAQARPELADRITKRLLEVDLVKLPTEECRRILAGKTMASMDQMLDRTRDGKQILAFVGRHLDSTRRSTAETARRVLARHAPGLASAVPRPRHGHRRRRAATEKPIAKKAAKGKKEVKAKKPARRGGAAKKGAGKGRKRPGKAARKP